MSIYYEKIQHCMTNLNLSTKLLSFCALAYLAVMCYVFYDIGNSRAHDVFYYYYRVSAPIVVIFIYMQYDVVPYKLSKVLAPVCIFFFGAHFPIKELVAAILSNCQLDIPFVIRYFIVLFVTLSIAFVAANIIRCVKPLWNMLSGGRN